MRIDTFNSFLDFFNDFHEQFTKDLGYERVNSIAKKVKNSKSLNVWVESALRNQFLPSGKNIVEAVTGNRHFLFSSQKIILVASILELSIIISTCGEHGILFTNERMLRVAKQIFLELKEMG